MGDKKKVIMKTVIKKIIIYNIVGLPVAIFVAFFGESSTPYVSAIIIYLYLLFILLDIGWSIKSKSARKKYIIYMAIIVSAITLAVVLGSIFGSATYAGLEAENTAWDALVVNIMFSGIVGVFVKIVKDNKEKYPAVKLLYIPIFAWGFGMVIVWPLVLL